MSRKKQRRKEQQEGGQRETPKNCKDYRETHCSHKGAKVSPLCRQCRYRHKQCCITTIFEGGWIMAKREKGKPRNCNLVSGGGACCKRQRTSRLCKNCPFHKPPKPETQANKPQAREPRTRKPRASSNKPPWYQEVMPRSCRLNRRHGPFLFQKDLKFSSVVYGRTQSDFIGIFKVGASGKPAGEPSYFQRIFFKKLRQI